MDKDIVFETKNYIKELKIPGIRNQLNEMIAEAYKDNLAYEELLRDLFRQAYDMRKENGRKNRIRNAKFPYKKYLDNLIIEYLPDEPKTNLKN